MRRGRGRRATPPSVRRAARGRCRTASPPDGRASSALDDGEAQLLRRSSTRSWETRSRPRRRPGSSRLMITRCACSGRLATSVFDLGVAFGRLNEVEVVEDEDEVLGCCRQSGRDRPQQGPRSPGRGAVEHAHRVGDRRNATQPVPRTQPRDSTTGRGHCRRCRVKPRRSEGGLRVAAIERPVSSCRTRRGHTRG